MTSSRKWLIAGIFGALPFILFSVLIRSYRIPTGSMENTILNGDRIGVLSTGFSTPTRGDIIVFRGTDDPSSLFVKRIVGIAADRIRIVGTKLYLNGTVVDEPYAVYKFGSNDPERHDFPQANPDFHDPEVQRLKDNIRNGEVVVPPNSYFVLGDSRDNSLDSRHFGFVPAESIRGRVLFVFWSAGENGEGIRWKRIFSRVH